MTAKIDPAAAATAAATQNTDPTNKENKPGFFMRCVKNIRNCCCLPETIPLSVGVLLTGVGIGLLAAGTVATGGALAAVGLTVGLVGVVINAIRINQSSCASYDLGNTAPPPSGDSSAADGLGDIKEGPDRETGYQEGTPQLVLEDEPERPRGLLPPISFTVDDKMEGDLHPEMSL